MVVPDDDVTVVPLGHSATAAFTSPFAEIAAETFPLLSRNWAMT